VVAGAVLLLQQLHLARAGRLPSVDDLEKWLRAGAVALKDGDDEDDTVPHDGRIYPRVDVVNAVNAVLQDLKAPPQFAIAGTVRDARGVGLPGARVSALPGGSAATRAPDCRRTGRGRRRFPGAGSAALRSRGAPCPRPLRHRGRLDVA